MAWFGYSWWVLWNCQYNHVKVGKLLVQGLPSLSLPLLCLAVVGMQCRIAKTQAKEARANHGILPPTDRRPIYALLILGCSSFFPTIVGLQWLFERDPCQASLQTTNAIIGFGGMAGGLFAGSWYSVTDEGQKLCSALRGFRNWRYGYIQILFTVFWCVTGALVGGALVAIPAVDILVTLLREREVRYGGFLREIDIHIAAKAVYFISTLWTILPFFGLPLGKLFPCVALWRGCVGGKRT